MLKTFARIISFVFHPLLVPTFGYLILLNSGFYFSMISPEAKRMVMLLIFFSTAFLPLITILIFALKPGFDFRLQKPTDRIVIQLSASIFYYMGYYFLGKMNATPVFRLFLIAFALLVILLSVISLFRKISIYMGAFGGMLGGVMALSFRMGINPVWWIAGIIFCSGLVGTARLILEKHTIRELIAGFSLGFLVIYLLVYFV